jgi:ATP-dependent Lhr-like helicase
MPPWRLLRLALRTLEDRGEARGGRFIAGLTGEQFALPDALESLYREAPRDSESAPVVLSASDPANLQGWLTPEKRVPAHPKNLVLFEGGIPRQAWEGGQLRELSPFSSPEAAAAAKFWPRNRFQRRNPTRGISSGAPTRPLL